MGSSALKEGLFKEIVVSGRIFMTLLEVVDVEPCLGFLSRLDCRLLEAIETAEEEMGSVALSLIFVSIKSRGYCQWVDGMKNQRKPFV